MAKVYQRVGGRATEVDLPIPWTTTVTTNASGVATVTIPAGTFTAVPIVSLTAVASSTTQATAVELVSVAITSGVVTINVKTWRTQSVGVVVGGNIQPVIVVAATVHVWAAARSV